jgi:cysteinyl-tRNA synthetase
MHRCSNYSMITLYNSLTRRKEEFQPLRPGHVGLYTCGPTVYDFPHIGNMRAYITWDILKRFLIAQGYDVTHIMNVTDVGHLTSDSDEGEDKMEVAKARERQTAWQIADKYFDEFRNDCNALDILPPTKFVKATDRIQDQIAFAKQLEDKGFLYRTNDGMYFDTSKDLTYGALGRTSMHGLLAGARVVMNPEKKNPTDFAVWKFSPTDKKRDMEWDSPWGKGFPGWHLECSVIAREELGDVFDIHTGGIDHLTIHHPNEIAQTRALTGSIPARYWLHNNFMGQKDKKMSKSAGTFVRLADLTTGGVSPLAYRYFALQTHYRKEIAYSWEAIQAAQQGLQNLYHEISFYPVVADQGIEAAEQKFYEALGDDLNTPKALDVMHRFLGQTHPHDQKLASVFVMDRVLGLKMREEWERRRSLPDHVTTILTERQHARDNKDWAHSDLLRQKLLDMDIEVQDTNDGQIAALVK